VPGDLDWREIDRYLSGEATEAEAARVRAWLAARSDDEHLARWLRQGSSRSRPEIDVEHAWQAVMLRAPSQSITIRRVAPWRRYAALIAAACILAVIGLWKFGVPQTQRATREVAWHEVSAPPGQRVTIALPDKSTMTLGPGSHARYANPSDDAGRNVYLDGEAYFAVAHSSASPFRVHAGHALFEDVGTRFTVRAYRDDMSPIAVVLEGEIVLRRDGDQKRDSARVRAGMIGRMAPDGALSARRVDTLAYVAWRDGRFTIDDRRLDETATILGRWFDVDVRLADRSMVAQRVTLDVPNASLASALDVLSTALDLDVRREGRVITLVPRRTPR
jgi:transmembrane sensor